LKNLKEHPEKYLDDFEVELNKMSETHGIFQVVKFVTKTIRNEFSPEVGF